MWLFLWEKKKNPLIEWLFFVFSFQTWWFEKQPPIKNHSLKVETFDCHLFFKRGTLLFLLYWHLSGSIVDDIHTHTHAPFFLYWVLVTWGVYVHDGYPHRDFFFFYFRFFFVRLVYRSNAIRLGEAVKRLTTSSFYFQGIIVTRGKLPPFLTSTTSLRSPIFGCCQQRPLILTLFVCW